MRYLPTGPMMKEADTKTIMEVGIPSMVLMERAALQCVSVFEYKNMDMSNVLIVCGYGNNGGDGLAIARLLHLQNKRVCVLFVGNEATVTVETRQQINILKYYGIKICNTILKEEYSVIIDCIFGIGLTRELKAPFDSIIEELNHINTLKVAIDIPTGICASTGNVLGVAFKANITIALAYEKIGTVLYPGATYAGEVTIVDIGIQENCFIGSNTIVYTHDKRDGAMLLPQRPAYSHKGTYGKILIIAGSFGMAGAAYLCSKSAYAIGAGLVQIYTHEDNRIILQQLLPEAMIATYKQYDHHKFHELLQWADVIAIGPGLGQSDIALQLLSTTLNENKKPCVIDADALNILSTHSELIELLKNGKFMLTPHIKEMSRLLNCTVSELQDKTQALLCEFVDTYDITCILKDARTWVKSCNKRMYLNTTGNSAMAKGGSGDVLTGIIAGLLGQKLARHEAAQLGVQLHGLSGDLGKYKKGSYSVLASDIIDNISFILKELEGIKSNENLY